MRAWYRRLEPWQQQLVIGELIGLLGIAGIVTLFLLPRSAAWFVLGPLCLLGLIGYLVERRAWSRFSERYPERRPPRWLRGEGSDDGRYLYLRLILLREGTTSVARKTGRLVRRS